MKFPVDLLADISQAELEGLAHNYMNKLLYSNSDSPERLILSDSTQVTIDISSVGFVPLYGSSDKQKILALFSPSDPFTAVALYLWDQWWAVDDILKTAVPARDGAVGVETVAERIVLYVLNRVIYRAKEMSCEELPFLCHGEKDYAKILWNNGEAVGFYSVKPSGSLCNSFSTRSYQLPVMDSIFVRKCQRGKGFGFQMLEDFVLSFKEDCLGLRYPLTKSMYKVCEKYLCQYPGDTDLLWEVESIGGPNQRTNIASKIQAMDLSVSKSISFTKESLVITEVTEKDVVMETITTQIKEAEAMECTVEIVEEVTVLRATNEAEVPARGRSSGSKRRKMGEKITEDKSEKVIRIEDIEAETPREEQVSAQLKTELPNVSELIQTEAMFNVAPEEKGEDVVVTTPERVAATMSGELATVLASQVLEEADVTLAPTTEEPQVEDDATQDLNNPSRDSLITVKNVASEIEEVEEECQKEDTAMLVVSEEVLELHKEETLDKVGKATQIEVTDEKLEERVILNGVSLSRHTTSEDGSAGKTGTTVGKAIKTVQSETPTRRSQRHSKPEEGVKEETTTQDGGRVLRGRTVLCTPTPKHKYTRHSQKVCEELEKEVDEVTEGNEVSTTEAVEESTVTEGENPDEITSIKENVVAVEELREEKQQMEDEHLINEEETEKQEEPGVEDTVVKGSSTELPDTAQTALPFSSSFSFVTDESKKEQRGEKAETSVIQDKQEVSGEIEEPTKELTVVEEGTISKAEDAAEDVIPLSEVNVEESKEVQEEEETDGETETVSVMEADKEEQADDMIQAPGTVAAASETVIPDVVLDEAASPVAEEPQEKVHGSEIPKLQKATVVLVDLKTTCCHLRVKEAEKIPDDGECAAPEKEQLELIAEEKVSSCVAEEQTPEPEMLVLEEENVGKQENITETSVDATTVAYIEKRESAHVVEGKSEAEETPVTEARVLRSGRKTVEASCKSTSRCNQQQADDNIGEGIAKKEVDEGETGTVEVEGEMEGKAKDAITVRIPVEEKQSTVLEICADTEADIPVVNDTEEDLPPAEVDEPMSLEEEQAPVVETRTLKSGTKTVTATPRQKIGRSRKQVDEQEAENGEEEEPAVITRTLTQGSISASATPKGKSRGTHKQIQEGEKKREEEYKSVKETGVEEEEAVKEAAVEKTDKEREKQIKMETGEKVIEEAASEREESLESKTDLEEEKAVAEEGQEEQSEVEKKELITMEKRLSEEGTMTITEEEENMAGVTAAADNLVQGETDTPLHKSTTDSVILTPCEEEATPSEEEQQSEEMAHQISDLERVTVILVDLKKTHCDIQEETGAGKEGVPVEKTAAEAEEEQRKETTKAEETMAEEGVPCSPVGIEKSEMEKVEAEEEGFEEKVEDAVTIHDIGKGRAEETAQEDVAKSVDEVEEEPIVTKTRTLRSRKKAVKATPRCKLERSRQKRGDEEKEEASEIREDEQAVPVSVLSRGRKSISVAQRCTTKRTHKQLLEEEEGGESAVEEREAEEEEEQAEEQQQMIDQEKGEKLKRKEKDATQKVENIEPEMGIKKADTVAGEAVIQQDAPEEGQASSTETVADEDAEAPVEQSADEGKTSDDVAEEAVTTQDRVEGEQSTSTSEVAEAAAGESAQETLLTAKDDEAKGVSEEEKAPIIETKVLRSGEKTVRATRRSKTTKRQGDEQEEKATGEKSSEDEPAVETRVLRKGRSAAATPKSKRACTQGQKEEGREKETTEKIQVEETKGNEKEDKSDEKIEEKDGEKAAAQTEKNTEPEVEMEKVEAVAKESLTDQETVEEERSDVSETCADGQEENLVGESAQETHNTDEEESPVGETRVLRSGGKAIKDTLRSKTTKSQQEENEQEGTVVEQSAETEEPAAETRVLRKGRRSAPATPRRKSKRARTQCLVTFPAEETEGEDEEAGQESLEEEGKSMEIEVKKDKDVEEEEESAAGGESAVGDAEQMKDASTEEAAVFEKEDNSVATVDETGTNTDEISSAEIEETNSAEEEEITVIEKSTAATEVGSDTAITEEEVLIEDASVVAEEEAPAVTTTLRRQTKTSHATSLQRSRRQKDKEVMETQKQKEETPEDDERQEEVHQLTNDSPENRKLNAEEQAETEETSPTGQEAAPPAEDIAEDQAKETAGEEPATEEMQSPEEELSESTDKAMDALVIEGGSLRRRMKTVADKGKDKAEEIQFPKQRSIRKGPRVDYRENDEEDEGGETEAVTDKEEENKVESDEDEDNKTAECSANELIEKLEESSKENLENNMGAIDSTSEKGNVLDLVLDTDEEVEGAGISQEDEEHELNMSEEEVEPIVIGKRVLRGRSVPSVIITPQSKSKRHSAKVQIAEESLSDEEKSPKSAQKRSLRKRKSTEVIPTRKSKRHSKV